LAAGTRRLPPGVPPLRGHVTNSAADSRPTPPDADTHPAPEAAALSAEDLAALARIREQDVLRLVADRGRALAADRSRSAPETSAAEPVGVGPPPAPPDPTVTLSPTNDPYATGGWAQPPELPGYMVQRTL